MNSALQVNNPTKFVCNKMTSTYTFNTAVGSGSVNSLECACAPNTCATTPPTGAGVVITAPTADTNCLYTVEASCTNAAFSLIFNMDMNNPKTSPQQLTCNNGIYQYNDNSVPTTVNNIECGCNANPCTGSFTSTGLTITELPPDNMCEYSVQVECTDPTMTIITINMDNNNQVNGPATFICNINTYLSGNVDINSLQCGCGDNTCTVNTEAGVELGTPTANAMCVYTVDVTCTNPDFSLIFDSDTSNPATLPQTLTCSGTQYQYNSGTGTVSINNIQCACGPNPCENTLTADADVDLSAPTSDGTCTYTVQTTCLNAGEVLVYDGNRIDSSGPITLTCNNPPGLYNYENPPISFDVTTVSCECPPNVCENSFTTIGTDITVSAPLIIIDCIYAIDVTCADPANFIEINQATNNVQSANPSTFACDPIVMKYYNTRINQVNIDTLECGCGANPCPTFPTEPGVDLTTPTVDGMCVYTLEATCANTAMQLIFNVDVTTAIPGPQTITCTNGMYQYNGGSGPMDITNLECGCRQVQCFGPTVQAGVDLTTPVSDNNCVYTLTASCTLPAQNLIFNFPGTSALSPQTLTCSPGDFSYQNPAAGGTVGSIQCQCPDNSCLNSYLILGAGINVMQSTANDACNYPIDVSCTDPNNEILVNFIRKLKKKF
uniref:Uncharacterized protein n=1 Tax=Panagrolaimus sp. PS1159 TaxID=55785 RepID=A0AC35GAP8_9BILA